MMKMMLEINFVIILIPILWFVTVTVIVLCVNMYRCGMSECCVLVLVVINSDL